MLEEQETKSEWSKREMGAFWTKDGPKGKYLTGNIEVDELGIKKKIRVVVFANKHKNHDRAPDYVIYKSEPQENTDQKTKQTTEQQKVTVEQEKEQIPEI